MQQRLIIYAKRPLPGYAKTRLGAAIGADQAAGVYARLLYTYLLDLVQGSWEQTRLELCLAEEVDCPYFERAFPEFTVRPQTRGDLGTRMAASFDYAFREGAESVILTGSDIPGLTTDVVQRAFGMLRQPVDAGQIAGVVGPAIDGGYYLIGMRAPGANLFEGIEWSTCKVLAQTRALAAQSRIRLHTLPELSDIDVIGDLAAWPNVQAR